MPKSTNGGRIARARTSNPARLLPQPKVEAVLDDIVGGEENLLPVSALFNPLRVEFDVWPNSHPKWGPETLTLFWGNDIVETKTFTTDPIPPDELFIMVPVIKLAEGEHKLRYQVVIWNLEPVDSDILTVTIDKTAPLLNTASDAPVFPDEIIRDGVTARYLDANHDEVLADVPPYLVPKLGDTITWYWSGSPVGLEVVNQETLTLDNIGPPLPPLVFDGDTIRRRGDGERYAHYQVQDRAGNKSQPSARVRLRAAAEPVPRDLPWPSVKHATPGQQGRLDPLLVTDQVVVTVPETATIEPNEQVIVYWEGHGTTGRYETFEPVEENSRDYIVPSSAVPANINRTVKVYYSVTPPGMPAIDSKDIQLTIGIIPEHRYSKITCEEAHEANETLRLSQVPSGAHLSLEPWVFIAQDQLVNIWIEGVTHGNQDLNEPVLRDYPVNASEVTAGLVGKVLPYSILEQLQLDERFYVKVTVRFDPEVAVTGFPRLSLQLIA